MVLKRTFGPKREEVVRGWRRLHNEELHNYYPLMNIVTVIKERCKCWAVYVARMREMRNSSIFCLENLRVRDQSEDVFADRG